MNQGRSICEKFLGYDEGFLLLHPPQERLWLALQGRIQGSHGVDETWNKIMIIINHPHKFLELPDGSRARKHGDCIDFQGERANS